MTHFSSASGEIRKQRSKVWNCLQGWAWKLIAKIHIQASWLSTKHCHPVTKGKASCQQQPQSIWGAWFHLGTRDKPHAKGQWPHFGFLFTSVNLKKKKKPNHKTRHGKSQYLLGQWVFYYKRECLLFSGTVQSSVWICKKFRWVF